MSDDEPRPAARDLVRKRSRTYRAPETGRHHHIGAAPELQPLLGDEGAQYVGASSVQLASRTLTQLQEQRTRLAARMAEAAAALEFELAGSLRDDLAAVDAEIARRGA